MVCRSCCRSVLAQVRRTYTRGIASTTTAANNTASASPSTLAAASIPAAISSATPGISQPLSTPLFPSTSSAQAASATETKDTKKTKLQGSIPGGTELKGLAYLKSKPQVLAKEDDEYPAWLWTLLSENQTAAGSPAADLAAMTKKQRAKYERKQEQILKDTPKHIPIHEQSRDLTGPGDNAVVSLRKRNEVTKSSRHARRKEIRENNFLKGM